MKSNSDIVLDCMKKLFPNPKCELVFENNLQLVVAVLLSAQCTDKRVNIVTKELFLKCKTPKDYLMLGQNNLENIIKSCGLYHTKAKHILEMMQKIEKQGFPQTLLGLEQLSGVGRKTASCVMSIGFGKNAIAVDTHVFRIANRIGITEAKTPLQSESQLKQIYKQNDWNKINLTFVLFGRQICTARNPKCKECQLNKICKFYKNMI
ncbi:MAG: endonuclease III [Clostridia bacterium]